MTLRTPLPATLRTIIAEAKPHSDMSLASLGWLAEQFMAAHQSRPGTASVEVGTRAGGSALLMLRLLTAMYGERPPMLVTVDPYGDKPYPDSGDPRNLVPGCYGDACYVAAKKLLAEFPNHWHYLATGFEVLWELAKAGHSSFWRHGMLEQQDVGFVLLDGDHSWATIHRELNAIRAISDNAIADRPTITVVVDNVDSDPETPRRLRSFFDDATLGPSAPASERMAIVKVKAGPL